MSAIFKIVMFEYLKNNKPKTCSYDIFKWIFEVLGNVFTTFFPLKLPILHFNFIFDDLVVIALATTGTVYRRRRNDF